MSADTMSDRLDAIKERLLPSDYRSTEHVVATARQLMMEMTPPQPPATHPFDTGEITEDWINAIVDLEANKDRLEKRRGVLATLVRDGGNQLQQMHAATHRKVLQAFSVELTELLAQVREISNKLGPVDTATKAITNDLGALWKRLATLADDYTTLRDAQEGEMSVDVVHTSAPDYPGDDHASDLYLRNLDQLWPQWRRGGQDRSVINLDNSGQQQQRSQPWPSDPAELMLWLVRSTAQPWIPTESQLETLRQERHARANPMPNVIPGRQDKKPHNLNTAPVFR